MLPVCGQTFARDPEELSRLAAIKRDAMRSANSRPRLLRRECAAQRHQLIRAFEVACDISCLLVDHMPWIRLGALMFDWVLIPHMGQTERTSDMSTCLTHQSDPRYLIQ